MIFFQKEIEISKAFSKKIILDHVRVTQSSMESFQVSRENFRAFYLT